MRFKKTRIAVSVLFSILCLGMMGVRLRSFWRFDMIQVSKLPWIIVSEGDIQWAKDFSYVSEGPPYRYGFKENSVLSIETFPSEAVFPQKLTSYATIPMWLLSATFAGLATVPWVRPRFNSRTLLITVTVIAIGLWIIVGRARR
jgi:hypothetical protein